MAQTWTGYGIDLDRLWHRPGQVMAQTWTGYGTDLRRLLHRPAQAIAHWQINTEYQVTIYFPALNVLEEFSILLILNNFRETGNRQLLDTMTAQTCCWYFEFGNSHVHYI